MLDQPENEISELVAQLRAWRGSHGSQGRSCKLANRAADVIERLQSDLSAMRERYFDACEFDRRPRVELHRLNPIKSTLDEEDGGLW